MIELNESIAGNKQILLRAVFGKQQGPCYLSPVKDGMSNRLLGVDLLSKADKETTLVDINEDTIRKITDGTTINLEDEVDALHWKWLRHCKELERSFDDAQQSPAALFYIEDLDQILEEKISKDDLVYDAMTFVKESSEVKRKEICRLLGQRVEYFKPRDILDFLYEKAKTKPKDILDIKDDKDYKVRLFFHRLVDNKILTKTDSGYKYESILIGLNAEQAIYWLKDSSNADIVLKLQQVLEGGELPAATNTKGRRKQ